MPVEGVYRVAGLLPDIPEPESFIEEVVHNVKRLKNSRRKATALLLLKALVSEEEEEQNEK